MPKYLTILTVNIVTDTRSQRIAAKRFASLARKGKLKEEIEAYLSRKLGKQFVVSHVDIETETTEI